MSTSKYCLIRQPAGLGDILFCQKVAKKVINQDNLDVIWPIIPEFIDIIPYISSERISYVSTNDRFQGKELYESSTNTVIGTDKILYIPLQHADQLQLDYSVMVSKYKQVGLSYHDWPDYVTFNRDIVKEQKLYSNILNLKEGEEYIFVNKNYGSPPTTQQCHHININTSKRIVNMDYYEGFNMFDWCKVIERASEIHTVDTAIVCIAEKLDLCEDINIYSRWDPPNFRHVEPILYAGWKYNY